MSGVLAFIPARGGSKGIPGKNKRLFCGKPLVQWTIEQAKASKMVTDVAVSTDDEEVQRIAIASGALGWNRPEILAQDAAQIEPAILFHLDGWAWRWDTIVLLQPTSPLRTSEDIDGAVAALLDNGADSLVTTVLTHEPFFWRMHTKPYETRPRRQERLVRQENGSIYVFRTEGFLEAKDRLFGYIIQYGMLEESKYEIDTEVDWTICEALMQKRLAEVTA